jgi:hypothetical protein
MSTDVGRRWEGGRDEREERGDPKGVRPRTSCDRGSRTSGGKAIAKQTRGMCALNDSAQLPRLQQIALVRRRQHR